MSRANYSLSKKAATDLEDIWLYTFHKWSTEQADRYVNLIVDEIEYLEKNPKAGRQMNHIREGYRISKVKSHLLFYRLTDISSIEIVRILHERMNVENHFEE